MFVIYLRCGSVVFIVVVTNTNWNSGHRIRAAFVFSTAVGKYGLRWCCWKLHCHFQAHINVIAINIWRFCHVKVWCCETGLGERRSCGQGNVQRDCSVSIKAQDRHGHDGSGHGRNHDEPYGSLVRVYEGQRSTHSVVPAKYHSFTVLLWCTFADSLQGTETKCENWICRPTLPAEMSADFKDTASLMDLYDTASLASWASDSGLPSYSFQEKDEKTQWYRYFLGRATAKFLVFRFFVFDCLMFIYIVCVFSPHFGPFFCKVVPEQNAHESCFTSLPLNKVRSSIRAFGDSERPLVYPPTCHPNPHRWSRCYPPPENVSRSDLVPQ